MASITKKSDAHVLLVGECDINEAIGLRGELEILIRRAAGAPFEIGFQELTSVNSTILSLMLSCVRAADAAGCQRSMSGLPQKLYDMARVGGLESILPLTDTH